MNIHLKIAKNKCKYNYIRLTHQNFLNSHCEYDFTDPVLKLKGLTKSKTYLS